MLNKKNLLIAVLCSLIAACLAYSYLEELEARVMSSNDTGNVVVAVVDIPEGTCITSDMIEERQISVDVIAMRASRRLQDVVGKSAIEGITKGEQIIETRLGSGREIKSFVNTISGGLRAVTLNVSEDCTFSGLLRPGDRLDIIGSTNEYGSGERNVYTYIRDVEVLAVGDEYNPYTNSGKNQGGDLLSQFQSASKARTVTLALTPEDVETIVMLEQFGNLKFALRSNVSDDNGNEDSVEEAEQSQPTRVVELIRGTRIEKVQFGMEQNES
jgi:pilus assembly protein CpaB